VAVEWVDEVQSGRPRGPGGSQSDDDGHGRKLSLLRRVGAGGDAQNFERLQRGHDYRVVASRRRRQHVWFHRAAARRPRSELVSTSTASVKEHSFIIITP